MAAEQKLFGLKPSTISGKIKRFARKAGVNIHCHSLRHHFGTQLVERGANPEAVRQLMRHESLDTTQRYIGLSGKGLRDAVELLDGPPKKTAQGIAGDAALSTIAAYQRAAPKDMDQTTQGSQARSRRSVAQPTQPVGGTVRTWEEDAQRSGLCEAVAQVSVEPGKGRYLPIELPSSKIWIDSIEVRPGDDDSTFQFRLFDREPEPYPSKSDIVFEEESAGGRITYTPTRLKLYHDRDEAKRLHCGIGVIQRHYRLDIDGEELQAYLKEPVPFTVTLVYSY